MNKDNLINYLEKIISSIKINNHNEFTREWSKGFLKDSRFKLIKEWEG